MKRYLFVSLGLVASFTLLFGLVEWLDVKFLQDPLLITRTTGISIGLVGILLLILDIFLPVPSSLIMIGNGAVFGLFLGSALSLAGGIISTYIGFFIGKLGQTFLDRTVPNDERERATMFLEKWGMLGILISRPIPLISETVAIMAGAMSYSPWKLIVMSFLGYLPASIIYALIGCEAVSIETSAYSFLLGILIAIAVWLIGKVLHDKHNVFGVLILLLFSHTSPVFSAGLPDSSKIKQDDSKKWGVLAVPAIGYEKETRGYIGAVALFDFKLAHDSITRTSNSKTEITYTQNHQFILENRWQIFSEENLWYCFGEISFSHFPQLFFGIGSNSKLDAQEFFTQRFIKLDFTMSHQILDNIYFGARYNYYNSLYLSGDALDMLVRDNITGSGGGVSSGAGFYIAYDNRNSILTPTKGAFLSASMLGYNSILGSEYNFISSEIDLRRYIPVSINNWKSLLALQFFGTLTFGDTPFYQLSQLGSSSHMRGYYRGRYRDDHYLSAQAEYRFDIYWRFAAAVFAGGGSVASSLQKFNSIKPSYGTGIRFLIDKIENTYFRIDYALGQNSDGFYISFGEAF